MCNGRKEGRQLYRSAIGFIIGVGLFFVLWKGASLVFGASPCDPVRGTPYFTHYYGEVQLGNIPAPAGTVVEARSPRGDTVGCFVVHTAGYYGLMRVYGEDAEGGIPGMREGEEVRFFVDGEKAVPSPSPVYWHNDRLYHEVHLTLPMPPSPSPTPAVPPSPTPSATPLPSPTPTPSPSPTPSSSPATPTPTSLPTPSPTTAPLPTFTPTPTLVPAPSGWTEVTAPGIYLAYDYSGHDPGVYHTVGSLAAFSWATLEPAEGQYDFSAIDGWLAKLAARGLKGAFFVHVFDGGCAGDGALPAYVRNDSEMVLRRDLGWTCPQSGRAWKAVPNYLNPRFQERWRSLIMRLGERYRSDPRVEFIAIGTGLYGETRAAAEREDLDVLRKAGLDSARWVEVVNRVGDWYREAFSDASGHLLKPLLQQTGAISFHTWERRLIGEHALAQGIGFSLNMMLPDAEGVVYLDASVCPMCGRYDFPLRYWQQVPTAWEAYELHTCTPDLIWWGVYNVLSKHPVYLRVANLLVRTREGLPRPENITPFAWAARYLGVTARTSPSAWVALREHRDPIMPLKCVGDTSTARHGHPQWGNYGFFMDQRDDLPGGHTVPETNDPSVTRMGMNEHPYNPALPPGKEGWATRRTDEASGNPRMYFAVADTFAYGTVGTVEVRVTYWDHGHDRWRLVYMDTGGNERFAHTSEGATEVQKSNTGKWRTVSFYLDDANFSNGLPLGVGGADFYIDAMGDGDEWIHFVEVLRPESSGIPDPTPSATPTAIVQATYTPTPTPLGPKAIVVPYVARPIRVDGDLSEWGTPLTMLTVGTADTVYGNAERADARVAMWAVWDERGLYLAFRVEDNTLVTDSNDIWRDDSIEIGIDADHDHHFTWGGPDFQFTVSVDGRWARLGHVSDDPHIERAVRKRSNGWDAAIHIPWSVLRIPPGTPGRILGYTFAYHDDDDGGNWDTYMVWAGERTNTSDARYADALLSLTDGVTPTPTPTPLSTPNPPLPCYRGIEGRVFWDTNRDGFWQQNEAGIGGLHVILEGQGRRLDTVTRETGVYTLVGVPPGDYYVSVTIPEGHMSTNANPRTVRVPIQRCARVTGVDFGIW